MSIINGRHNSLGDINEVLKNLNIEDEVDLNSLDFKHTMEKIFADCSDLITRAIPLANGEKVFIYYFVGAINEELLESSVIRPLTSSNEELELEDLRYCIYSADTNELKSWKEVVNAILDSSVICHKSRGYPIQIAISSQQKRALEEPSTEYQVYGPKVGFIEDMTSNLALMRQLIKDPRLKTKVYTVGTITHTNVSVMYFEGAAEQSMLEELERRIESVGIDNLLNIGQLNKQIVNAPLSVFPQVLLTERPDQVAFALTEGKVALFLDNSGQATIIPVSVFDFYLPSGDRSFSSVWTIAFVRAIRLFCMIIATAIPALYVALVAFHPELIPQTLAFAIAESRAQIPFPASAEAFMMMLALDILVEASIRLPSFVGQTIGIVGGLIIGTAAVEAGLVSSLMVIVIALTAIASFVSPSWDFVASLRTVRYGLLIIASTFGLFGFALGFCVIFIHICHINSFSRPYVSPAMPIKYEEIKQVIQTYKSKI